MRELQHFMSESITSTQLVVQHILLTPLSRVRECIHRAEDRGVHDSNNTDRLTFQGAMTLAQELESVIDDFMVSLVGLPT